MGVQIKQNICFCDLDNIEKINIYEIENIEIEHKSPSFQKFTWTENIIEISPVNYNLTSFFNPLKTIRLLI